MSIKRRRRRAAARRRMILVGFTALTTTGLLGVGYTAFADEVPTPGVDVVTGDLVVGTPRPLLSRSGVTVHIPFTNIGPEAVPPGAQLVVRATVPVGTGTVSGPECTAKSSVNSCELVLSGGAPVGVEQASPTVTITRSATGSVPTELWFSVYGPIADIGGGNYAKVDLPAPPS